MRKGLLLSVLLTGACFFQEARAAAPPAAKKKAAVRNSRSPVITPVLRTRLLVNEDFLKPQPEVIKYREPADLLELIPFIRDINRLIPRRFSLANHQFQLASNEMVIRHNFTDTRTRLAPKTSIISFSYVGGLGSEFDTRLDVPLFYSSVLGLAGWYRYPIGNYTMTITRTGYDNDNRLFLRAVTRF